MAIMQGDTGSGGAFAPAASDADGDGVVCFGAGTGVATPVGQAPVEALRPGDRVLTRDGGFKPVAWIGRRDLLPADLVANPAFQPVLIRAGSLAPGMPDRDLLVSPQHRILLSGHAAELHFGEHEVLAAALHLVGRPGIERLQVARTTYLHLLFERHEVILSNGAWTESFQPADRSLGTLGERSRAEVLALFPDLARADGAGRYLAARPVLRARDVVLLR